ncbi:MAG TPA: hypothetical protein VK986_13215, partial [Tepidisphaeraceae bacterium]|nr:hypothetical protein [Tepidisphaeraceae bacterium]
MIGRDAAREKAESFVNARSSRFAATGNHPGFSENARHRLALFAEHPTRQPAPSLTTRAPPPPRGKPKIFPL